MKTSRYKNNNKKIFALACGLHRKCVCLCLYKKTTKGGIKNKSKDKYLSLLTTGPSASTEVAGTMKCHSIIHFHYEFKIIFGGT